jgi:hypothetical protein
VKEIQKQWLGAAPWESVLAVNKALCQTQRVDPLVNPSAQEAARRLWEAATPRHMALNEVLELCHQCHELAPFIFNNGNTFAAIGQTLVEDWLKLLPPVEAQIIRTTVGHYIVGLIPRKELLQVLRHFERTWQPEPAPVRPMSAPTVVRLQPQTRG